jgi:hypothetical protein
MKKLIQLLIISSSFGFSTAFAGNPVENKAKNNINYTSPDNEVKLYVVKARGGVQMQVIMPNAKNYDQIIFEKSNSSTGDFTELKTVACDEHIKYDGAAILEKDKISADTYYRIVTISSDGAQRTYSPVLVAEAEE